MLKKPPDWFLHHYSLAGLLSL